VYPARFFGLSIPAILAVLSFPASFVWAQGGPPFRSDDPDTPGNKHWEINVGSIGDRNPATGSYQVPDLDFNYGVGHRIQLTFEIPVAIQEVRGESNHVLGGLGNSEFGVKYRFYAHHTEEQKKLPRGERESNFGFSVYPQLLLNNPTSSVDRGVAEKAPQWILPVQGNCDLGILKISAEVGYLLRTHEESGTWFSGVVVDHEFQDKIELAVEVYAQHDVFGAPSAPKPRETTIALGGRLPIAGRESLRFIWMAGRSLVGVTPANGQPSWIAYAGIQFLIGPKRHSSDYVEPE